jgi:eukaryotic-like serine/threonine-protein kinase
VTALDSPLANALKDRYSIERELGQGGMATVYLAQDLRHHRRVAVKVLRPELAATLGAERFLQEIETAAQFQHPHILPLLDSGKAGGFLYYVMPYVDGESLRARLARQGEFPVHDAVKVLIEVCDALAYAHERGIVHRDIKPDNVLLSGRHALVTDFGVAKALSEATGRQQLTTAGIALGTPTYMAPEQATADPNIDHRVDIYALGVLGYELIAGKPPFSGRSPQETLAAHVTQRPEPLCALRSACPPGLEAVIMKCLEKRPADRWQTAEELLAELEPLATPSGGTTPTTTRPIEAAGSQSRPRSWRTWVVTAAVTLALVALGFVLKRPPPEVRLGRRVQLTLEPGLEIDPALSPDGKLIAFAAGPLGQTRVYVRQSEAGAPVAITPARGFARMPRWSPDGQRLLFRSERGLEMIPALGGASRLLLPQPAADWLQADWSPDGRAVVYASGDSVLVRSVEGGTSRVLGRVPEAHSCSWSGDGRWIACVSGNSQLVSNDAFGNIAASSIWVIPAAGGAPIRVTDEQSLNASPAWLSRLPSLLFVSSRDGGRELYQVNLTRSGHPARPAARLTTGLNAAQVAVSADGKRLAYAASTETSNIWSLPIPTSGVTKVSRAEPVTTGTQIIENFDISPDGSWIAFDSDRGGIQQIYRKPLASGEPEQLTTGAEPAFSPSISRNGREIAYHSFRAGRRQVFVLPAEGGTPTQVTNGNDHYRSPSWSPDGRTLAIVKGARTPAEEIDLVARDAVGHWTAPRPVLKHPLLSSRWAPDGRSVLTVTRSNEGRWELVVVPAEGSSPPLVLTTRELNAPLLNAYAWSASGRLVYYLAGNPDGRLSIWSVPAMGGAPRLTVTFDDPARPWHRSGFRVHGNRFCFTLGDRQSDIWTTEVVTSR